MAIIRQTNFSAGELEPQLWGRTDLPSFAKGARTAFNFFISKNGSAVSRPGTRYIAAAKNGVTKIFFNGWDSGRVRLLPFIAGDSESFVLELGDQYLRVYKLGQRIESAPGVPYELATPWGWGTLERIRFAQVGEVMTLVHPQVEAQELRHFSDAHWTLTPVSFKLPVLGICRDTDDQSISSQWGLITPEAGDSDHPAREWRYQVTAITREATTGATYESLPFAPITFDGDDFDGTHRVINDFNLSVYPDHVQTLRRVDTTLAQVDPANAIPVNDAIIAYNIYRGRGGIYGYLGTTESREFIDIGDEPDFTIQPPQGTDPFQFPTKLIAGFPPIEYTSAIERPGAVTFFQNRRWFAGGGSALPTTDAGASGPLMSTGRQGHLWGSRIDDYTNFDKRLVSHVADEAVDFELAAMTRQANRHLLGLNRLVVLTDSSVWVGGGHNGPLTFDSVDFQLTDLVGATDVEPLVIEGTVLWVRTKGSGVRALVPQDSFTPYVGHDISEHARHMFLGHHRNVLEWAHARDPWGVVWAVRDDGTLLSLTYSRERQMAAWTRHQTDGVVESICSVPEGDEDAVYMVVRRDSPGGGHAFLVSTHRSIERMTSRVRRVLETDSDPTYTATPTVDDIDSLYPTDVCVDAAFTYAGAPTQSIVDTELLRFVGKQVYVVARGAAVLGPYAVTLNGGDKGQVDLEGDLPAVNALSPIGEHIWVAHVGLAYRCDLESLAIYGDLSQKTIVQVGFELDQSRGIQAGQSFSKLTTWKQRQVSDAFGAISAATVLLVTPVTNAWDKAARVCLRQELPLPVTVLGITREVERGD